MFNWYSSTLMNRMKLIRENKSYQSVGKVLFWILIIVGQVFALSLAQKAWGEINDERKDDGEKRKRGEGVSAPKSDFSLRSRRLSYPVLGAANWQVVAAMTTTPEQNTSDGDGGIIWRINTREICHLKVINDSSATTHPRFHKRGCQQFSSFGRMKSQKSRQR